MEESSDSASPSPEPISPRSAFPYSESGASVHRTTGLQRSATAQDSSITPQKIERNPPRSAVLARAMTGSQVPTDPNFPPRVGTPLPVIPLQPLGRQQATPERDPGISTKMRSPNLQRSFTAQPSPRHQLLNNELVTGPITLTLPVPRPEANLEPSTNINATEIESTSRDNQESDEREQQINPHQVRELGGREMRQARWGLRQMNQQQQSSSSPPSPLQQQNPLQPIHSPQQLRMQSPQQQQRRQPQHSSSMQSIRGHQPLADSDPNKPRIRERGQSIQRSITDGPLVVRQAQQSKAQQPPSWLRKNKTQTPEQPGEGKIAGSDGVSSTGDKAEANAMVYTDAKAVLQGKSEDMEATPREEENPQVVKKKKKLICSFWRSSISLSGMRLRTRK